MDGVEALAQEGLPFGRVVDFAGLGRIGEEVKGFDELFVEVDEFVCAALLFANAVADDRGDAFEIDGAAFEIIAVDVAEDVFSELKGDGILLRRRIHEFLASRRLQFNGNIAETQEKVNIGIFSGLRLIEAQGSA